jgi:hypothetical protein
MRITREEARAAWRATGLRLSDLAPRDLADLRRELDRAMRASQLIRGSLRAELRVRTRRERGRLVLAELRCRSDYFEGREAVTFNRDGFVGLAGWADEVNVQPVLEAFVGWARERARPPLPA